MNKGNFLFSRHKLSVQGLALGFGLLLCGSASAAELLKNGDFESAPVGVGAAATNWTLLYLHGGPEDFEIKDRTRGASAHSAWYGGHFRPRTQKLAHACFTQTVTGLTQTHQYTVSGLMWEQWWDGAAPYDPIGGGKRDKYLVYIEAIGGSGDPTPDGRASVKLVNDNPPYVGYEDLLYYANGVMGTGSAPTFGNFTAKQTPDANGKIEVRLHFQKVGFQTYDKNWQMSAFFDDISLVY